MKYNHDNIEEVFQVLRYPEKNLLLFKEKYRNNQSMLDLYEELRKYKEAGLKLEEINKPNVGLEWQKVNHHIRKKKQTSKIWWSAASIIILLSLTFVMALEGVFEKSHQLASQTEIKKGDAKALLITSTGEEYELEDGIVKNIQDHGGIEIKADSNNVVQYGRLSSDATRTKLAQKYNTLKVPRFGEYQLVLADGTKVWLNSESELRYPIQFNQKERIVDLIGEAYFDVKTDPDHPFVVRTKEVDTRVLGTEFNVSSYPKEELNITLVEGKVQLNSSALPKPIILHPGENANRKVGEEEISVKEVDVNKYIAWRDGFFYFERERLEDIFLKLERWYDFKVFYQNQYVKDYLFRMRADRKQEFHEITGRLEQTGRISIEINGNVIVVSDVSRE
jgi:hypothetical protein